jgi:ABC-type uncharacterized transport system auxiliary subunit
MRARGQIIATSLLLAVSASLATGCFRRQFPERRQYVVSVERPAPAHTGSKMVIKVGRVRAEPQYERKGFVYRTGELTYSDDFYNAFYVSPAQMVRSTMQQWLVTSGLFVSVADVDSLIGADWLLESRLLDFYVDRRMQEDERAVVRLAVTLVDGTKAPPRAIFERTYEEAASATGGGRGYVDAWGAALAKVYARMEADLAAAIAAPKAR